MSMTPEDLAAIERRNKLSTGPRNHISPSSAAAGCYGAIGLTGCPVCDADRPAIDDRAALLAEVKELWAALLLSVDAYHHACHGFCEVPACVAPEDYRRARELLGKGKSDYPVTAEFIEFNGEEVGMLDGDAYSNGVWGGRIVDSDDVCDQWQREETQS